MNNKELTTAVATKIGVSQKECSAMLDVYMGMLCDEVVENGEAQFLEIGTLEIREKEQKMMYNPLTGKRSLIPPKLVVGFRPSASIKNQIREEKA